MTEDKKDDKYVRRSLRSLRRESQPTTKDKKEVKYVQEDKAKVMIRLRRSLRIKVVSIAVLNSYNEGDGVQRTG